MFVSHSERASARTMRGAISDWLGFLEHDRGAGGATIAFARE